VGSGKEGESRPRVSKFFNKPGWAWPNEGIKEERENREQKGKGKRKKQARIWASVSEGQLTRPALFRLLFFFISPLGPMLII